MNVLKRVFDSLAIRNLHSSNTGTSYAEAANLDITGEK
jgi:hypothetical protein